MAAWLATQGHRVNSGRPLQGQHLHRAAVAQPEVRGSLPARLADPECQYRALDLDPLCQEDLGLPIYGRCQAYLLTSTCATIASVGRPERIRRSGAGTWTTAPAQARQPYFGRRVTRMRCCAGMTSSRSDFSSPITCIASPQQGQDVVSGSMTTSIRGRCAGSDCACPARISGGAAAPVSLPTPALAR